MKKIILFFFILSSITGFAQSNEAFISYQALGNDDYGKGMALSYYRQIAPKTALALKVNINAFEQTEYSTKNRSISLDVLNRKTLINKNNFRLMGAFGFSVLRDYTELYDSEVIHEERNNGNILFCGFIDIPRGVKFKEDYPGQKWFKSNHYGLASMISVDYTIKDIFIMGASYGINIYRTTNEEALEQKTKRSNLNISLGIKF